MVPLLRPHLCGKLQVILPKEQKQLILNTVSNFEAYKRCRKKMGLDDAITYGAGMVMLFHGPPGTGKTMMANALANKLNKKVLFVYMYMHVMVTGPPHGLLIIIASCTNGYGSVNLAKSCNYANTKACDIGRG